MKVKQTIKEAIALTTCLGIAYVIRTRHPEETGQILNEYFREDQFNIVVKSIKGSGKSFSVMCYPPGDSTGRKVHFISGDWISHLDKVLEVDDTLQKEAGEIGFLVRKKDYNLLVPYRNGHDSVSWADPGPMRLTK